MDSMPLMVTSMVRTLTELLTSLIFLYSKLGRFRSRLVVSLVGWMLKSIYSYLRQEQVAVLQYCRVMDR